MNAHPGLRILLAFAVVLSAPAAVRAQTVDDCTPAPAPIDFDDLTVGDQYGVGETFTSGAAGLAVLPLVPATEGIGFVMVDPAGDAGGSGLELFVNDALADFSFPTRVDGISLRFLHGTGVGRLALNGVARDTSFGFPELDGQTIGGVLVSIVEGEAGDEMTLDGRIRSFAIGGVELYVDDVAPRASCPDLAIQVSPPRTVDRGSRLEFPVVVENIGTAAAGRTEVVVTGAGSERVSEPVGPLGPGGSEQVVLTVAVSRERLGGTEEFTVTVDPAGSVNEIASDNNQATLPVRLPAPDLRLTIGSWTLTDERIRIPIDVSNEGDAPSRSTIVIVTADGWPSLSADVRRLGSGRSVPLTLDMAIPESARGSVSELTIALDPEGVVPDPDPSDNVRQLTVEIPGAVGTTDRAPWVPIALGAIVLVVLLAIVAWRLVRRFRGQPPVTVSARLVPGSTELVVVPEPDGSTRHTVRLVPRFDPGVQLLQEGRQR